MRAFKAAPNSWPPSRPARRIHRVAINEDVVGLRLNACVGKSKKTRRSKRSRSQRPAVSAARREPDALELALSAYDPDELWTLIFAAATSPGNRHRSVTLGSSFAAALRASAAPAS